MNILSSRIFLRILFFLNVCSIFGNILVFSKGISFHTPPFQVFSSVWQPFIVLSWLLMKLDWSSLLFQGLFPPQACTQVGWGSWKLDVSVPWTIQPRRWKGGYRAGRRGQRPCQQLGKPSLPQGGVLRCILFCATYLFFCLPPSGPDVEVRSPLRVAQLLPEPQTFRSGCFANESQPLPWRIAVWSKPLSTRRSSLLGLP